MFPIYRIGRDFFSPPLCLVLAVSTSLLSAGAIASVIWAEPLYFSLFVWMFYAFVNFRKQKSWRSGSVLGILLSLLFLTRQTGIIPVIGCIFTLFVEYVLYKDRRGRIVHYASVLVPIFLLCMPWMIRTGLILNGNFFGNPKHYNEAISGSLNRPHRCNILF